MPSTSTATAAATSGPRSPMRWPRPPTTSRESGWQAGETWGYEVRVPAGFNHQGRATAGAGDWQKLGVKRVRRRGTFRAPANRPASSCRRAERSGLPDPQEFPGHQALQQRQRLCPRRRASRRPAARLRARSRPMAGPRAVTALDERQQGLQLLLTVKGYYSGRCRRRYRQRQPRGDLGLSGRRSASPPTARCRSNSLRCSNWASSRFGSLSRFFFCRRDRGNSARFPSLRLCSR